MAVPLLDLKSQNGALDAELKAAFARVLASGQYIMGPENERLERELAVLAGTRFALGVSSGTDAILLALMALGIGPGDEVICPSFTFFATAGCIARTGATPVFADSVAGGFNVDPADIARRVTSRTKAIIPVHLFGQMADMEAIREVAASRGLAVIEDAAQALGSTRNGTPAGSIGNFGTYSFFPSKNLGCLGDGGALVTNDPRLAERARILRVHGMEPKYFHQFIGGNFRLDPLQAAFLQVKLPHYAEYTRKRRANAAFYLDRLALLPGVCIGAGEPDGEAASILLPEGEDGHIWNQFTLRVRSRDGTPTRRDALRAFLLDRGIGSEIYYPKPLHTQDCFAYTGQVEERLPQAERLALECLSLPVFPELTDVQKEAVVDAIAAFLKESDQKPVS
jgi:dTDP-4-amino-4,6-dideoxygalactose transaminase